MGRAEIPGAPWAGFLVLAFLPALASAQPSIASEDINNQFDIMVNGVSQSFTVMRDARSSKQWYFAPNTVSLAVRRVGNVDEPEFQLLRYQARDPQNPQNILEGGILQFAATLAAPAGAADALRQKLAEQTGEAAANIQLAPLPMRDVKINFYSPDDIALVRSDSSSVLGDVGPVFATQKMPFSINLTALGADVYDGMTQGLGVPVSVTYSFQGLTKPAGFKITVDWDKTFDFYSSDSKLRAQSSLLSWGAAYSSDRSQLMETLRQKDCVKFEAFPGETLTLEKMLELAGPYLDRINKEVLEKVEPPNKMEPAQASEPPKAWYRRSVTKVFGNVINDVVGGSGGGYSVAVKKASFRRTGKSEFSLSVAQPMIVSSGFGGFIGIGGFPDEVRARLVTFVEPGPWKRAFLILPNINDQNGITSISIVASVVDNNVDFLSQVASWAATSGWTASNGSPVARFAFPLSALPAPLNQKPIEQIRIKTTAKITKGNKVEEVVKVMPAFDGEDAIITPLNDDDVEWVEVDATGLPWKSLNAGNLGAVSVELTSGADSTQVNIRPALVNGQFVPPPPQLFLFRKSAEPLKPSIRFFFTGQPMPVDWPGNDVDLRGANQSLFIFLDSSQLPAS